MIWDGFFPVRWSIHFCIDSWSFPSTFSEIHFRSSSELMDASRTNLSSTFGRNTFFDFFTTIFAWRKSLLATSSSSLTFDAVYTFSYKFKQASYWVILCNILRSKHHKILGNDKDKSICISGKRNLPINLFYYVSEQRNLIIHWIWFERSKTDHCIQKKKKKKIKGFLNRVRDRK